MSAKLVIDVSNNNGIIAWDQVFTGGKIDGVYSKASQGTTFTDKYYGSARAAAAKHGVPFGAYHFFEPLSGATEQADHFCAIIQKLGKYDLRPALDYETGGLSPGAATASAKLFSKRVREHLGVYPLLYTYTGFLNNFTSIVGGGLWLANFGADDGKNEYPFPTPRPWKKALLHQFTQHGKIQGIKGDVDLSFAHGKLPYAHPWLVKF